MKKSNILGQVALWSFLLMCFVVFAVPYLFMISNSFEKFSYSLPYPPRLIPKAFNLEAYQYIITKKNILTPFFNSVVITSATAFFSMIVSALSAYGFARIDFTGRNLLFRIYLFTLMIPGFLSIIPQFLVLRAITLPGFSEGLIGTRTGLVLLYVSTGICGSTFFLKGFFETVPKELEESVIIDGGGHGAMFFSVMLPMSKPALSTMAIFTLQGTWEEFFSAKVILGAKESQLTLPIIIQRLQGEHATRWEWVFAASIMMQLPIILLFVFFQKKFVVSGLTEGAIKG